MGGSVYLAYQRLGRQSTFGFSGLIYRFTSRQPKRSSAAIARKANEVRRRIRVISSVLYRINQQYEIQNTYQKIRYEMEGDMARPGITYEMVEAAADALSAERPGGATLAAVRAKLGTGSPNTIHKFLKMWNENRPKMSAPSVAIPDDITRVLSNWVVQASTGSRAEAEERSLHALAAADDLARVGEDLEAERDQLLTEIVALTTQRDQHQATADERAVEIQRLLDDVDRERGLAGAAQVDAAQARLRVESQVEHLVDMRARVEALRADVELERAARNTAERDAAVISSQLASLIVERDALRGQVVDLQQELVVGRDRIDEMRAAVDARVEHDQERLDKLRANYEGRLQVERDAVAGLRADVGAAAVENAQLQARFDREQQLVVDGKQLLDAQLARVAKLEVEKAELRDRLKAADAGAKE